MNHQQLLEKNRVAIFKLAAKHGATNLQVFGSVARGEANEQSDLDLLVEALPQHSRFFPCSFTLDLEDLLGCKVDVVERETLHKNIREQVLKEAIPL